MLTKRHLLGIIIAPIAAPLVFAFFLSMPAPMDSHGDTFDSLMILMAFGVPIAYLVTIFFGLPIFMIFERFGWMNFWSVSLGGGIVAVVPLFMLYLLNGEIFSFSSNDAEVYGVIFVCGLIVGIIFWFLSIRKAK